MIKQWITASEEMGPKLAALGITWKRFTGTQYQGCTIPDRSVYAVWGLWDEGKLMFGDEEGNTRRDIMDTLTAALNNRAMLKVTPHAPETTIAVKKRKPARRNG